MAAFLRTGLGPGTGGYGTGTAGTAWRDYSLDGRANWLQRTAGLSSLSVTTVLNLLDAYTSFGSQAPTYNLDGSLATVGSTESYGYNTWGEVSRVVIGTTQKQYTYDGLGRRVAETTTIGSGPFKFNREEWRIFDDDADFLDRGNQKILIALALEHRGEQTHQGGTPDRCLLIEPGAVGGDPHVDIAAKRRIPQVDGGQSLTVRLWQHGGYTIEPAAARFLPCLRHCFLTIISRFAAVRNFVTAPDPECKIA